MSDPLSEETLTIAVVTVNDDAGRQRLKLRVITLPAEHLCAGDAVFDDSAPNSERPVLN
jgi:hypothetical protein